MDSLIQDSPFLANAEGQSSLYSMAEIQRFTRGSVTPTSDLIPDDQASLGSTSDDIAGKQGKLKSFHEWDSCCYAVDIRKSDGYLTS